MIQIDTTLIKNGIEKFGELQLIVAIEELSELQKVICKDFRGYIDINDIAEEVTDVIICLSTIKEYYKITDEQIQRIANVKMERLR